MFQGLASSKSLIHQVLRRIDEFVTNQGMRTEWLGGDPENGVIEVETSREFYRFWSALSFLFCAESQSNSNSGNTNKMPSDEEQFGHGFTIAGMMLVYLLGQYDRFQLLDFSSHVLKVQVHG